MSVLTIVTGMAGSLWLPGTPLLMASFYLLMMEWEYLYDWDIRMYIYGHFIDGMAAPSCLAR